VKAGKMIESKFLKKDDVEQPVLVTIKALRQTNVAMDDQPEDLKWTITFREFQKPMVLNSTNIQLCTQALGTDETDEWIGKTIVLYNDPNVSFGGKLTGGIRIRAPKKPKPVQADPPGGGGATPQPEFEDDDIPFVTRLSIW